MSVQEKVNQLENELRMHSSSSSYFKLDRKGMLYIGGWIASIVAFIVFLIVFQPGFTQVVDKNGDAKLSFYRVFQYSLLFAILSLIGSFVWQSVKQK